MKAVVTDPLAVATPETRQLYEHLLMRLKSLGPFEVEKKKTCVHLARATAFAGVHLRKQFLILTIKSAQPIQSDRIVKAEQTSRNRWHVDVRVATKKDVDATLVGWLERAYELCG
jgi:uncharacterized protein DUF5655